MIKIGSYILFEEDSFDLRHFKSNFNAPDLTLKLDNHKTWQVNTKIK